MASFGAFLSATLRVFQIEFNLFGVTLSFWQVFLWSCFAAISLRIVFEFWSGD